MFLHQSLFFTHCMNYFQVPGRMGMVVTIFLISVNVYNSVEAPPGRGFRYDFEIAITVVMIEDYTVYGLSHTVISTHLIRILKLLHHSN